MIKPFSYRFEWDVSKARRNLQKHGIAFERAATIFQDPDALSEFDEAHSRQEDRWITMGIVIPVSFSWPVTHSLKEEPIVLSCD